MKRLNRGITGHQFWDNIDIKKHNECWNWKRNKHRTGYGSNITVLKRCDSPHRHAYSLYNGAYPPKGLCVLHKCDNPLCCNPHHLFIGSHRDNMFDMAMKGRSGHTKLTEDQVRNCIKLRKSGKTVQSIADKFKISRLTLSAIFNGIIWKHITNGEKIQFGTGVGNARLTKGEILQIIDLRKSGKTIKEVAAQVDVTYTMVYDVLNGRTWKNITKGLI